MKKIVLKLLLAIAPVFLLLGLYFVTDPFEVLYHYASYFPRDGATNPGLNKDYLSTQAWLDNYPKYHYDSYIFGSSRSMNYRVADWQKHINSTACFHFDAYAESLYGIERKFQFLEDRNVPVKNALIIFDRSVCRYTQNREGFFNRKHPALSGQNKLAFQLEGLKGFFRPKFLNHYLYCLALRKPLYRTETHYEVESNEVIFQKYEHLITSNPDAFYLPRKKIFRRKDNLLHYSKPSIVERQKILFYNISRIATKNHTNIRIVISPLYNQKKLDSTDVQFLDSLFGKDKVWDFSGINEFTNDIHNYYERSHYRPTLAARLMDSIYKK